MSSLYYVTIAEGMSLNDLVTELYNPTSDTLREKLINDIEQANYNVNLPDPVHMRGVSWDPEFTFTAENNKIFVPDPSLSQEELMDLDTDNIQEVVPIDPNLVIGASDAPDATSEAPILQQSPLVSDLGAESEPGSDPEPDSDPEIYAQLHSSGWQGGSPEAEVLVDTTPAEMDTHTVVAGESLWLIARDHYGLDSTEQAGELQNAVDKIIEVNGFDPQSATYIHPGDEIKLPPAESFTDRELGADWNAMNDIAGLNADGEFVSPENAPAVQSISNEFAQAAAPQTDNVLIIDHGKIFHGPSDERLTDITADAKDQVLTSGSIDNVTAQQLGHVMNASGNPEVGVVKDVDGPVPGLLNNNSYSLWYDAQTEQFTVIGEDVRKQIENGNIEGTGLTEEQAERYMAARQATHPYLQDQNTDLDNIGEAIGDMEVLKDQIEATNMQGLELDPSKGTVPARIELERGAEIKLISPEGRVIDTLDQADLDKIGDSAQIQMAPNGTDYLVEFDNGSTTLVSEESLNIPPREFEAATQRLEEQQQTMASTQDQIQPTASNQGMTLG